MATGTGDLGPPQRGVASRLNWNDPSFRAILYQVFVLGLVGLTVWYLVSNLQANLASRNIATGFGFLGLEAGFGISESLVEYSPASTYGRAIFVGILNTLRVAVIGIILATILGTIIGVLRLSKNWLIAKVCSAYVETMRNLPLLLQLFFWYAIITETLPSARQALNPLPGIFLSQRGINFPVPEFGIAFDLILIGIALGIIGAVAFRFWARKRQDLTGQQSPVLLVALALLLGLPFLGWLVGGAPTTMSVPELRGFNFRGGASLSPEFAALLVGLTAYTAAFIAEIVRSGILAVTHGQTEASLALGLTRGQTLRLVVLPQALRVIVPPMTSQYLNITKNSSLAVAIGYPDVVSIANTAINQTGQAIEGIALIMAVYLSISLGISLFMNWYNKRIALVER